MPQGSQVWPRAARLKGRRLIRPLFDRTLRSTVSVGAVRLLYRTVPESISGASSPVRTGFAVGRQRTAVRRNALRRALRESFRTSPQRAALQPAPGYMLTLMVLCRKIPHRLRLQADLDQALGILATRLKNNKKEV